MSITANPLTLRITRWIAGRDGPEAGDVLLDRRRVYILPTAPGLGFGVALLVLLVGSINYSLQLGFLLTFLVASSIDRASPPIAHGTTAASQLMVPPRRSASAALRTGS